MTHYADYVRGKLEDMNSSLIYLLDNARRDGGPSSPSKHQKIKLEGVFTEVRDARRVLNGIFTLEDPTRVRREVVSLSKKLDYIHSHINGLLSSSNHEEHPECGLRNEPWIAFRQIIRSYKDTTEDLLDRYRDRTKTL